MSKLISVTDAAELLGKHPMTVRRWASEGRIESRRVGGQWRIMRAAVEAVLGLGGDPAMDHALPHPHEIKNDWIQRRRTQFQAFVHGQTEQFRPDYLVLVDRKGRLFDSLSLIPPHLADKVLYPSALHWMSDDDALRGKRIIVLEESIQRGRNLRRIRESLESHGAEVLSLTLIRRRSLFESGELVEPTAVTCLDLSDQEFAHATAQISAVLQSDVICLDVDHFPACQIRLKSVATREAVATALGSLGRLFLLPTPSPGLRVDCFTVDAPNFFDWSKLRLPRSVTEEGVLKLRVYHDYRTETPVLYIVPVVFPEASFTKDEVSLIAQSGDEAWSRYIIIPEKWNTFSTEAKVELLFRCLVIYCSTQLLLQALPHLRSIADDLPLDLSRDALSVTDQGLSRTFGSIETAELADRTRRELTESWEKITQPSWHPVEPTRSSVWQAVGDTLDDSKDVDDLFRILTSFPHSTDPTCGLSRTELLAALKWDADRLSRVFDFALDRGLLKPLVEIRGVDGHYRCLRTYRATEYGSWRSGSEARTPEALAAKRISLIIPYVLDRLMSKGGSLSKGVPDMLRDKIFTNLQHDWDVEKFGPLYLGWAPHFFGPLPNVPALNRPSGGFQSIGQFAIDRGVCELKSVDANHPERKLLLPRNDVPWREKFEAQLTGIERDYLEGLIDIYYAVYHAFEETGDPLTTLASCRNRFLTYVCGFQDLVLWRENMELALEQMDLNFGNPKPPSCIKILERATAARKQVEDKLRRYGRLDEAKSTLSQRLKDYPRAALAQSILQDFDPPTVDDNEPYPLGRMQGLTPLLEHVTTLVHLVATKLGMAVDKRSKSHRSRNCQFYIAKLREAYPEFVSNELADGVTRFDKGEREPTLIDLLRELFVQVTRFIGRQLKDPQDYSTHDNPADKLLAGILEATSSAPDSDDTGILLIDIMAFVSMSVLSAEIDGLSLEDAAAEVRTKVREKLMDTLDDLSLEPKFMDPVGGDGWLIVHDDVDALIDLACRLNRTRSATLGGISFKISITHGNPKRITSGASVGRGFIKAYYVAEKSGMLGGTVRLTEEAAARVSSQSLRDLLKTIGTFELRSFDPCELYELQWQRYGET